MAAFFLHGLDERMARTGLFYIRFMDDFLVLAPTRWKLRRAVAAINEVRGSLRLEKHPGKTFIGRIEKEFDFLAYHFSRDGIMVAKATMEKFVARASRLYEQDREELISPSRLGMYVNRWRGWVGSGPAHCSNGSGHHPSDWSLTREMLPGRRLFVTGPNDSRQPVIWSVDDFQKCLTRRPDCARRKLHRRGSTVGG